MRVRKGFIYILLTAAAISLAPCHAARSAEPDREELNLMQAANEMRASGRVQLNFKDVEIVKFLRFMSELLGENILVDPGITGTVSVVSPKAVTLNEAREVMLSVLEMNNLILEQMDGYSKVTPASGGAVTTGSVVKSDRSVAPGEAVIVQVVPLNYVKAGYVVSPLKTAIKEIQVSPVGNGSSVLLVGKASLLNRAVSVIRALDAPDSIRAIKVVPLSYANAKLLEAQMNAMGKDASSKMAGLMAVADERTGRIVLIGSAQGLREAERVIKELDLPSRTENFHVYKLHNADAKTVAEQLSQILATAAKLSPDKEGGVPSTVVPDLPTNSLIFTASQEQYNSLKSILEQLDTQPKQVMLRGLIAQTCSLIVTHAREGVEVVRKFYPSALHKVHFIDHPTKNRLALLPERMTKNYDLLIWGHIARYKGVFEFVDFLRKNPQTALRVCIVGTCSPPALFEELKAACPPNVTAIHESPSFEQLATYIAQARFVLVPYHTASVLSSGILMDSLSYGAQIIGPRAGSFDDYAVESALHVYTFDSFDDIPALVTAHHDDSIDYETYARFLNEHNWPHFVQRITRLLSDKS